MNFEQHDNFLLADWTCPHSPLSAEGQKEITLLEEFYRFACDQAAKDRVQAVLWIQKVPCYDASPEWLDELANDILRDQLRARILRLHKLTRLIRSSPIPWIYATEKDCTGTMFELMAACHRRFVFERETWFGFPEFAIGQVSALGWLGSQLHKQPGLAKLWMSRSVISAEEAVQTGVITAALTWKDWRRHLLAWMQQQIIEINASGHERREMPNHPSWSEALWPPRPILSLAKSHIESYQQLAMQPIPNTMVDRDLIDTASHFMMQSPYQHWLKQEVQRHKNWGRQSIPKLIYFDITDALPPMATFNRLLERGARIVLFAADANVVRSGVEVIFTQLNARYSRDEIQQFNSRIAWFVGTAPEVPECYTMRFGMFREFSCLYRENRIEGWAMLPQKSLRQTVELYGEKNTRNTLLRAVTDIFDGVYLVKDLDSSKPLLFWIRSLILQMLVYYCQDSRTPWAEVLEQLNGTGWTVLGNGTFWERFLAFRGSDQSSFEQLPDLGRFKFDRKLLAMVRYADVIKASSKRNLDDLESGPGYLHRSLISFAYMLTEDLFAAGFFESLDLADLYLCDAIGFPAAAGSPGIFVKRLGLLRAAEAKYVMEVRSY
ncbi:MAG: enoyl-CoA hydratase/isomerase family protein [Chitinophagaceae bacterium]|nr:enoyl-CoA hydratase/isomerase family protein [Oligoflexus sp.]